MSYLYNCFLFFCRFNCIAHALSTVIDCSVGLLFWPGCANAVPANAAACMAVLANTFTEMVLAHMVRLSNIARYGKWSQRKGMGNADQVSCGRSAHEAGRPRCGLLELWRECCVVGRSEEWFGPALRSPPILLPLPVLVQTHPI